MPIFFGTTPVAAVYRGNTNVTSVWWGSVLIPFGKSVSLNGMFSTQTTLFDQRGTGSLYSTQTTFFSPLTGLYSTQTTLFDKRGTGNLQSTQTTLFDKRGTGNLYATR